MCKRGVRKYFITKTKFRGTGWEGYQQTATLEEEWVNSQIMKRRIERKKLLTYWQIKNSQRIGRIGWKIYWYTGKQQLLKRNRWTASLWMEELREKKLLTYWQIINRQRNGRICPCADSTQSAVISACAFLYPSLLHYGIHKQKSIITAYI